ncbi:MAG: septal ring lytic transglycosylase RlpA family protein [Moraxella sp.]|nr:septal ring lytic transglycosylase RlpA family protein [Moraxella sp.]
MRLSMKHKLSAAVALSLAFSGTTAQATTEPRPADIEHILSELSRQQDNASSLVKAAREPASLAAGVLASQVNLSSHQNDDVLGQLTAVASNTVNRFKQTGLASWYGRQFHGKKTASGERFDMNAMTAAHRSLPMNCYVRVTNKDNGKSVVVRINDRGPFHGNRVLDLSYGAAKAIGITEKGVGNVTIERVEGP